MVLALLGEDGPSPEWMLGMKCGRARQQVHRSLAAMKKRGLVRQDGTGRKTIWELTEKGQQLWRCLDRGIGAWETELSERMDLEAVRAHMRRVVQIFLNRPHANGGWRRGLSRPHEWMKMPIGLAASIEGLLEPDVPPAATSGAAEESKEEAEEVLLPPPGWGSEPDPNWTARERDFIRSYWSLVNEPGEEGNRIRELP